MGSKKRLPTGERKQHPSQAATAKKRSATNSTSTTSQPAPKRTTKKNNLKSASIKKVNKNQQTKKCSAAEKVRDKAKEDQSESEDKKAKRTDTPTTLAGAALVSQDNLIIKKSNESNRDIASTTNTHKSECNNAKPTTLEQKHNVDKKDDKTKALNKMLKNLDIQISGFDNILPKEQHISSISENVKTKSRAAAVRVAACLGATKSNNGKRWRGDDDKNVTTPKEEPKHIIINMDTNQKESQLQTSIENVNLCTTKEEYLNTPTVESETEIFMIETKKKMAAKKLKMEMNQKAKRVTQIKMKDDKIEVNEPDKTNICSKKKPNKNKTNMKTDEEIKTADNKKDDKNEEHKDTLENQKDSNLIAVVENVKEAEKSEQKSPKLSRNVTSPKIAKCSPKNSKVKYNSNILRDDKKEETLKIVLDANTEVVQMDIEEIPVVASSSEQSIEHRNSEKVDECKQLDLSEKSENTLPTTLEITSHIDFVGSTKKPAPLVKQKSANKFATLQGKSVKKAKPVQESKGDVKTNEIEGVKNDVYDFKSGSEEEENIKMELPILKDLRELSSTENKLDLKIVDIQVDVALSKTDSKQNEDDKIIEKNLENNKIDENEMNNAKKSALKNIVHATYKNKSLVVKKALPVGKLKKNKNTATKKNKVVKKRSQVDSDDSEDEKKLSTFGKKRHRMASLNALAKVQCLYENESRTAYELGLSKAIQMPPKMRNVDGSEDEKDKETNNDSSLKEKDKEKDFVINKEKSEDETNDDKNTKNDKLVKCERETCVNNITKVDSDKEDQSKAKKPPVSKPKVKETSESETKSEPKRKVRNVAGGRGLGKHWEMDSDSENDEFQRVKLKKKKWQKKVLAKKDKNIEKDKMKKNGEKCKKADNLDKSKQDDNNPVRVKRKYTKRKNIVKSESFPVQKNDKKEGDQSSDKEKEEDEKGKDKLEVKKPAKNRKRILKEELIGDYKGILARKRMASLNATAIVAATYEVERHVDKSLAAYSSYESSDENEKAFYKKFSKDSVKSANKYDAKSKSELSSTVSKNGNDKNNKLNTHINEESNDSKYSKETKETVTDTTAGMRDTASIKDVSKEPSRPTSTSVVIVQDTDVTITGVYVNATTGSSQEAYCKMQYRVQSSVTAEERVLRPSSVEPPKSYTPLSALSSMLPPGTGTGHSDAHGSPPPVSCGLSLSGSALSDALNVGLYPHASELGIHTEPNAPEHGPPPPSYAAAAAAAAAAYHAHHMQQYAHSHHQYQQAAAAAAAAASASDHVLLNSPQLAQVAPPQTIGGHHYGLNNQTASHYSSASSGMPPPSSPPPTYRACAYPSGPGGSANVGLSMSASGSSAFCSPNMHHQQQIEHHKMPHQQQQQQQHHQQQQSQHHSATQLQQQHDASGM